MTRADNAASKLSSSSPSSGDREVLHVDVDIGAQAFAGEANHLRALVDPDDDGAARQELLRVQAGAAPGIEHPLAPNIPEQIQDRGTVVERVVGAAGRMPLVVLSERVVQGRINRWLHDEHYAGGRVDRRPRIVYPLEVVLEHHLRGAVRTAAGRAIQTHRGLVVLIRQDPHGRAAPFPAEPLQLLDEGASHAPPARVLHDADLVQEELGPLVGVEDLDRRDEPRRSIVDVPEQQVVPLIEQEPTRLVGEDVVVERRLEPSDLVFVARRRPSDPDSCHRLPSCERNEVFDPGAFAQRQSLLHVRDDGAVVEDERRRDAVEDRPAREQRPGRHHLGLPATRCPRRGLHDAGA